MGQTMMRSKQSIVFENSLCEDSPLRRFDPRSKLFLCLAGTASVMLPVNRLIICFVLLLALLLWSKLLKRFMRQIYRMKWVLIGLFVIDWLVVNIQLAEEVTLRLILLASFFTLFFSTTKPEEFGAALEKLKIPYRYAFSISLTFQSLELLQTEWKAILEAQKSRGILPTVRGLKTLFQNIGDMIALMVPAIVLTTRRAWAITESAYTRGFDSPQRIPYNQISMTWLDWITVILPSALIVTLYLWR